jgi:hypothetical protein
MQKNLNASLSFAFQSLAAVDTVPVSETPETETLCALLLSKRFIRHKLNALKLEQKVKPRINNELAFNTK